MLSLDVNVVLAAAGGCLDAFTYVGHGHVFANAMTGNVVLLAVHAVSGDWHQSLRHLPPIVTFLIGVSCVRALGLPRFRCALPERAVTVLVVEILSLFALSWLPAAASDFLIVTAICFTASLQTATFRHVNGAAYNSTFVTGNLRTLSEGFFDWIFSGRRPDSLRQAIDFGSICLAFFLGALCGGILTPRLHNRTLFLVVALLVAVLARLLSGGGTSSPSGRLHLPIPPAAASQSHEKAA